MLMWDPLPSIPPAQVAMDRMKKIKRQLSMTLRGGRGVDKTNGAPEQIGLDESGGGGGNDLGEVPTRAAPGEPRSGRGPLSSAPGGSTDHFCPQTGPRCHLQAEFPLDLCYFHFPFSRFLPLPCYPLRTHSLYLYPFPWLCAQASGRKSALPAAAAPNLPFALLLRSAMAPPQAYWCLPTLGLPSQGLWLLCRCLPPGPGPAPVSAHP